jgi:transcription elongation factor GreB
MSDANYITPEGARRLQEELQRLLEAERPKVVQDVADAAAQGDRSENAEYIYGKKRLREIDRRIHWLTKRLDAVQVVHPREAGTKQVFFGAWVEIEDEEGERALYRIVGEDETDPDRGHISWRCPIGRALLSKREGDVVTYRRPVIDARRAGAMGIVPRATGPAEVEVTIVEVRYEAGGVADEAR